MKHSKITILLFLVIFFTFVSSACATGLSLSLNTFSINFSTPTERALDDGYIDKDSMVNVHAVKVRVSGGDEGQSWKLYVRADDSMLSPGVYGKGCGDLKWKFDHENANSYRKVRTYNQLVASGSGVANVTKYIDLRMLLDWSDPPAGYSLGLTFTLKAE
ncbi:MAG: hypothetical protein PF495_20790 [Spirochaetales bacterium]|jgi:hypothetical protein|nr:hypothetical protein [Spirochaetales bacterium]